MYASTPRGMSESNRDSSKIPKRSAFSWRSPNSRRKIRAVKNPIISKERRPKVAMLEPAPYLERTYTVVSQLAVPGVEPPV